VISKQIIDAVIDRNEYCYWGCRLVISENEQFNK